MRECGEDGKGWRVDEFGNWWPCSPANEAEPERDEKRKRQQDGRRER